MAKCLPNKLHQRRTLTEHQFFFSLSSITLLLLLAYPCSFCLPHRHIDATRTYFAINPLLCFPVYPVQFTVWNCSIKRPTSRTNASIRLFWESSRLYNAVACCVTINHSYSICVCSIVASWEVNAMGHPVVLPLNVCEELLQVIDESNSTLPASMRNMRSYEVRHLLCTIMGNRWLLRHLNPLNSHVF